MNEGGFQSKVLRYLNFEVGGYWIKIHGSSFQSQGEPDIVGCFEGRFYAFELKRPDGKGRLSPKQKIKLSQIRREGGTGMMIDDMNQLREIFGTSTKP